MLRLSKLADYGTVLMVHLARQDCEYLASAKDIAEATHLRLPTVSKLLKFLAKANLLLSVRGSKGGYRLSRSPDAISMNEIIQALEDKQGLTECSESHSNCVLQGSCTIKGNWQLINKAIFDALDKVSLSALAKPRGFAIKPLELNNVLEVE